MCVLAGIEQGERLLKVGNAHGAARNHALCDGPVVVARVTGDGYPTGCGWSPDSEGRARRLAAAWNASMGVPLSVLEAGGAGAFEALLGLVREASAPGGIGEHEFSRPGGWRERALKVLGGLEQGGERAVFYLFEMEVVSDGVERCFVVSARGETQEEACEEAQARVCSMIAEKHGCASMQVLAVECQGYTQCDHIGEITGEVVG